jgi:hypothetical protein
MSTFEEWRVTKRSIHTASMVGWSRNLLDRTGRAGGVITELMIVGGWLCLLAVAMVLTTAHANYTRRRRNAAI